MTHPPPERQPRWVERLRLAPIVLSIITPFVLGGTAWVTAKVDAANTAKEKEYRREFVLIERYESDQKAANDARDQIRSKLESMDKKIDALLEKRAK